MKSKRFVPAILFFALLAFFASACFAAVPEYAVPRGVYQVKYDMFFSVWKPDGLPPAWFATFDGYIVRELSKNNWIYGIFGSMGEIYDSDISVGSLDPRTVILLRPLPQFVNRAPAGHKNVVDSLLKILNSGCDSFSIVKTDASFTPVAWKNGTSDMFIWSGKKWIKFSRLSGETFKDSLRRESAQVAEFIRKNAVRWTIVDTAEFASFVRTAGYVWIEEVSPENFGAWGYNSGEGSGVGGGAKRGDDDGWDTGR